MLKTTKEPGIWIPATTTTIVPSLGLTTTLIRKYPSLSFMLQATNTIWWQRSTKRAPQEIRRGTYFWIWSNRPPCPRPRRRRRRSSSIKTCGYRIISFHLIKKRQFCVLPFTWTNNMPPSLGLNHWLKPLPPFLYIIFKSTGVRETNFLLNIYPRPHFIHPVSVTHRLTVPIGSKQVA